MVLYKYQVYYVERGTDLDKATTVTFDAPDEKDAQRQLGWFKQDLCYGQPNAAGEARYVKSTMLIEPEPGWRKRDAQAVADYWAKHPMRGFRNA